MHHSHRNGGNKPWMIKETGIAYITLIPGRYYYNHTTIPQIQNLCQAHVLAETL
jgi:hypothetical protein